MTPDLAGELAPSDPPGRATSRFALVVTTVVATLIVAVNLFIATRGLDRTDEGMYLNLISRPDDDPATVLLFGYAYHPIYVLLGGSIVGLRWFGMLLTVALGMAATWTVLGLPRLVGRVLPRSARAAYALGIGSTGLFVFLSLPLSPGYNSLVLQSLLVVVTGLALAAFGQGRQQPVGWALVGAGGWFVLLAKATSGAAIAVLVLLFVILNRGRWVRYLPIAVATCAVSAAPLFFVTSATRLVERLQAGAEIAGIRGSHAGWVRWDPFFASRGFVVPALAVLLLVVIAVVGAHWGARPWLTVPFVALAAATAALASWWWIQTGRTGLIITHAPSMSVALLALLPLAFLPSRARPDAGVQHELLAPRKAVVSFIALLVLLPLVATVGSNQNLWMAQGRMTIFWVLAATVALIRRSVVVAVAPVVTTTLLLAAYAVGAIVSPYRYPSLLTATEQATVTSYGATINLRPDDARETEAAIALGKRLGVDENTWIVDLTGENPGYIHALGGRAAGQAWLLGGYRGSAEAATAALRLAPCTLSSALVLDAPEAPRRIDPSILSAFGLALERDYKQVGTYQWLRYADRRVPAHLVTVRIMAPVLPLQVPGCSTPTS